MSFRAEQAELYRPTIEPQDYEMVEFFIKRLKLWMGLTKAKEACSALAVVYFIGRTEYMRMFYSQCMLLIPHISFSFLVQAQGEVRRYGHPSFQVLTGIPSLHPVFHPPLSSLSFPILLIFIPPSLVLGSLYEV